MIENYEKALVIAREKVNRSSEGDSLNKQGRAYMHLGQVEKAIENYEKALVIAREIGDLSGEGNGLNNLGSTHLHLGQVDKARQYLKNH